MLAFSEAQRGRYQELRKKLVGSALEINEEHDGYSFCLDDDHATIVEVAEWIALERLCCPFLHFTIEVLPAGGSIWLKLGEGPEIKEFLKHEFSPMVSPAILTISPPTTQNER